ncbi:uncharacterized protein BO97DRAFT_410696 [Aspergillus homomorphus CBS 101889]|uniref:F-box domain-containing protein n=1 Tax=Aspergillus homomorphus (strain CBS 101889) TaxID=1450537 RepID=A0A395IAY5_ASPHC|nr:hypothetical protein BO97DRAFT_410696 [Aspergillus homomorphus CBS 101889]RAL16293.1 hypothetical protein BO97DRAFT_410696 [Aspergillus homomorphus CBS 101889]
MDADEHETANLDNIPVELFWHVAEYLEKEDLRSLREIVLYHVRRRSMSVGPFRVAIESEMKHNEQNLHKLCCVLAESRIEVRYLNLFLPLVVEPELQFIYLNLEVNCKPLPDGIFTVWGQLRQLHVHEPEDNKAFRYVRNLVPVILANAPRLEEYRLSGSKDRSVWEGSPWPSPPPLKSLEFNDPWINLQDMLAFLQWVGNTLEHVRFYHARCIRSDFKWSDILQFMKEGCPMLKYVSLDSVHRDWLGGVEPIRWQGSAECEGPHDRERMLEGLDRMIVATLARMI